MSKNKSCCVLCSTLSGVFPPCKLNWLSTEETDYLNRFEMCFHFVGQPPNPIMRANDLCEFWQRYLMSWPAYSPHSNYFLSLQRWLPLLKQYVSCCSVPCAWICFMSPSPRHAAIPSASLVLTRSGTANGTPHPAVPCAWKASMTDQSCTSTLFCETQLRPSEWCRQLEKRLVVALIPRLAMATPGVGGLWQGLDSKPTPFLV